MPIDASPQPYEAGSRHLTGLRETQQLYHLKVPYIVCVVYCGVPDAPPLQSRAVAGGLSVLEMY